MNCEAQRYDKRPCEGSANFVVRYMTKDRAKTLDSHPACFRHGLAEVERHNRSGGIAVCELVPAGDA
jgi:hypothetical protein